MLSSPNAYLIITSVFFLSEVWTKFDAVPLSDALRNQAR
jgi:hypothetical protein